jgi:hypothetical protein
LLRASSADILHKMAELAQEGDVRAASLIFKFLERDEFDDNSETLAAVKQQLSRLQKTVVGEIISLLAEVDAGAKAAIGAVEPPK